MSTIADIKSNTSAANLQGPIPLAQPKPSDAKVNLNLSASFAKPTTDEEALSALKLHEVVSQGYGSSERPLLIGEVSRTNAIRWADIPPEQFAGIQANVQNATGGKVTLNPNDPISKGLEQLAEIAGLDTAKDEGKKLLEVLKKNLGEKGAYAVVGVLASSAAGYLAANNPGLLLKFANDNAPKVPLISISGDNAKVHVTLQPQATEKLVPYAMLAVELNVANFNLNRDAQAPANGERIAVGSGTMIFNRNPADGSQSLTGAEGKTFPLPAPIKNPEKPSEMLNTSRAQIAELGNSLLKVNNPLMSEKQVTGIATADLLSPIPKKDGADVQLQAVAALKARLGLDGVNSLNGSATFTMTRAEGPSSIGYNITAIGKVEDGKLSGSVAAGGVIPINDGSKLAVPFSTVVEFKGGDLSTKVEAGVEVRSLGGLTVSASMTNSRVDGTTYAVPIKLPILKNDIFQLDVNVTPSFSSIAPPAVQAEVKLRVSL